MQEKYWEKYLLGKPPEIQTFLTSITITQEKTGCWGHAEGQHRCSAVRGARWLLLALLLAVFPLGGTFQRPGHQLHTGAAHGRTSLPAAENAAKLHYEERWNNSPAMFTSPPGTA